MTAPDQLVQIEKPVYGGSFLVRVEGQAVFVPLVLPGEQARIRIVNQKRGYATAEVSGIVSPAPQRISPACPHFGACGGCHYQHTDYATQLQLKQVILRETFERAGVPPPAQIDILSAQPWGYRNRIRLAFDASGNPGYRGRRSHAVVPITECPIAAPLLVRAAKIFAETARRIAPTLRFSEIVLFCNAGETALQASVFLAASAPAKQGKTAFDQLARACAEQVPALAAMELVAEGRPGNRNPQQFPRTLAQWGAGSLVYRAAGFDYRVDHGAFFQVNRFLVDALVNRVTDGRQGNLAWDLFAGVGLFARQLSANFRRVIAV
jgi:23S rRNA (uracil1939-C5)-methyltransferase